MPESNMPAQNRGAAEVHFASLEHDGLVKWKAAELVIFAEEDSQQDGMTWNLHGLNPFDRIDQGGDRETGPHPDHAQGNRQGYVSTSL